MLCNLLNYQGKTALFADDKTKLSCIIDSKEQSHVFVHNGDHKVVVDFGALDLAAFIV